MEEVILWVVTFGLCCAAARFGFSYGYEQRVMEERRQIEEAIALKDRK